MTQPPKHAAMDQFRRDNDDLLVNDIPLSKLALRVGQTPFYAYDRSIIQQNIKRLRDTFPQNLSIHYAIKANPMPALVNFIHNQVDGLDIASGKELAVALDAGMPATAISFAGPAKSKQELLMALSAGITLNIESETEYSRIKQLSQAHQLSANLSVRVNPDFELKTSGMKMSGGAQQFGIDAERVPQLIRQIVDDGFEFSGLHIYTGSQNLNPSSICAAHNNIFALAKQLADTAEVTLKTLNIGGGFGIPYFPGEQTLDLQPIADNLTSLLNDFQSSFAATEVILELGRYLVGNAGIFVAKALDIKQSRGETFVMVDGGMHHHLAASGNFGQVIRKNYPLDIGNKMSQEKRVTTQVVGPLCTPLDILGKNILLPKAEVDDLIVIYQSGAYGYTASPKDFLSHPYPLEVLV